jgi:hypothetical protein
MKTRRGILIITAAWAVALVVAETQADVYKVGTGWGCTHRTLAEAVAAANAVSQRHVIRLTRSVSGQPTEVTLKGQLTIVGGYATCFAPESSGETTTLSGRLGGTRSILEIQGRRLSGRDNEINLHHLELVNGNAEEGGAILIHGGDAHVSMLNVAVHQNRAVRGGGIAIKGDPHNADTTTLAMERTLLYANEAAGRAAGEAGRGGGLYCRGADVHINSRTAVSANQAAVGGGIDLHACTLRARTAGRGAGVFSNRANEGGGIHALTSTLEFTSDAGGGLWIGLNEATSQGGGLLLTESELHARDLMLADNRASTGDALYTIGRRDGTIRSRATLINVHLRDNGNSTNGGAIVEASFSDLFVSGVVSQGNRAHDLFALFNRSGGTFEFVTSNERAGLGAIFSTGPDGFARVRGAIVAGNGLGPRVFASARSATVECLLTHETQSLPPGARFVLVDDPAFVDSAAGNLRLQPFSPAIDFCDATSWSYARERDADGRERGFDAPAGDGFGRFDLGAYEWRP